MILTLYHTVFQKYSTQNKFFYGITFDTTSNTIMIDFLNLQNKNAQSRNLGHFHL